MFCKALGGRFAALYNDLGVVLLRSTRIWASFCCVLQRYGGRFTPFCNGLGVDLLRSVLIWGSFCCVLD